jgi:hypothetical protein
MRSTLSREHAVERVAGVAALAADAVRSGEKPHFLVVTDSGSVDGGAGGELADFHFGSPSAQSEEGTAMLYPTKTL